MIPVGRAATIRAADRAVIEGLGVPGAALMEVASRGVAAVVRARPEAAGGVVVVCGAGNNGGDGYAAARWLAGWGLPVRIVSLSADRLRGDAATMRAAALAMGVPEVGPEALDDAGLIVDAIFGNGLDRPITGAVADVIARMRAPVVAVDLPSGVHADTGAILGVAPRAAATVTFGAWKPGLLAGPGAELAGEVTCVDIGLGAARPAWDAEIPEAGDLRRPARPAGAHKGASGHVLVVAGSAAMAGAAVLCCRGALAAGAGLVTLVAPRGARPRLGALPPEVMVLDGGDGDRLAGLDDRWRDGKAAVIAGPGLGGGEGLAGALAADLARWWREAVVPVVFDADALPCAIGAAAGPRVITPHPGEAGRLLGTDAAAVQADRFGAAAALADGRVALLKGRYTLVAAPGAPISVNPRNSPVLATGGSGDVLGGVIGGLLARGLGPRDAAILGAWVHGDAGCRLGAIRADGWTASDIAARVPEALAG